MSRAAGLRGRNEIQRVRFRRVEESELEASLEQPPHGLVETVHGDFAGRDQIFQPITKQRDHKTGWMVRTGSPHLSIFVTVERERERERERCLPYHVNTEVNIYIVEREREREVNITMYPRL